MIAGKLFLLLLFLWVCAVLSLTPLYRRFAALVLIGLNATAQFLLNYFLWPAAFFHAGLAYVFARLTRDAPEKTARRFVGLFVVISVFFFVLRAKLDFTAAVPGKAGLLRLIPLGFGYLVLQNLGFVIDVFRDRKRELPRFLDFLAASSFFAPVSAGPISPLGSLAKDVEKATVDRARSNVGFARIVHGALKKSISDLIVVPLLADGYVLQTPTLFVFPLLLFQFYVDFSAATDIAIGTGELFGLKMPENFDRPYLSRTMAEYWNRWHMSLGGWMRNYVFFPLQMTSLKRLPREFVFYGAVPALSVFVTFVLIGLWHGLTERHFLWGIFNGVLVLLAGWQARVFGILPRKIGDSLSIVVTLFLTFLGQLLLSTESIGEFTASVKTFFSMPVKEGSDVVLFLALAVGLFVIHEFDDVLRRWRARPEKATALRLVYVVEGIFLVVTVSKGAPFVYGRF